MNDYDYDPKVKPSGYSYRVSAQIWAGEYPVWDWNGNMRFRQLRLYTDFGITDFLDLTQEGEMPPYEPLLPAQVRRHAFPIPDCGVPRSVQDLGRIFDRMERIRSEYPERRFYIHCHGGVGRTGTIVACYLIHVNDLTADEAITQMRSRFTYHARSAWMSAPETAEQVGFIREFAEYRKNRRPEGALPK